MSESLVDKYRPQTLKEVKGHPSAIKKLIRWSENWMQGDEPIMLYGPAGTGKTSTAEALANDMDWAIEEVNASSQTRKDDIRDIVQAIRSGSHSSDRTLFLLDEVDSINGRSLAPLKKVLDDLPNPVIVTANDDWRVPDSISNACEQIEFKLRKDSIKKVLKYIAEKEDISISSRELGKLSTRNGLRDAINDLQEYSDSTSQIEWDERETDIGNFSAVENILRGKKYSGEMTPPDLVEWLDENIHVTLDGVEAFRASQCLREADKFIQRTNETQNYSWWRYAGTLAEEVASVRITEPYDWINLSYPSARRNKPKKSSYDDSVATLYRELKDGRMFSGAFSYQEFRNVILDQLKGLDKEERMQMCLSHSLSSKAMKAIDISSSDYDSWLGEEKEEEETEQQSISEFGEEDNDDSDDSKGVFDF